MSKTTLLDALNDSLDRLHAGQHVLDCLTAHPEHANELRPLLEAHDHARAALPDQREVAAAQARGRAKVLAALQTESGALVQRPVPTPRVPLQIPTRLLSLVAALVLLFGIVTVVIAQSALPGDALYGIKRFSERALLSFDDNGRLKERFAKRRIGEIESLLAAGRAETVSFSGQVEAQVDTRWVVAGLVLEVPPGTPGSDGVSIADAINVRAATTPDRTLLALSIELDNEEEDSGELLLPTPTPLPTMSSTPSPQPATLSPTATETPSVSPTATITQTQPATAVQACVAQLPDGWVTYHVRAGDTLSTLAAATGTTPDRLASVNCLEDSRLVISGQLLFVPRLPDTAVPTPAPQITSPPPQPPPEPVGPVPPGPGDDDDDDDDADDDDDDDADDDDDDD